MANVHYQSPHSTITTILCNLGNKKHTDNVLFFQNCSWWFLVFHLFWVFFTKQQHCQHLTKKPTTCPVTTAQFRLFFPSLLGSYWFSPQQNPSGIWQGLQRHHDCTCCGSTSLLRLLDLTLVIVTTHGWWRFTRRAYFVRLKTYHHRPFQWWPKEKLFLVCTTTYWCSSGKIITMDN